MSTTTQVQASLPTSTILPKDDSLFEPYFTDIYSQLANAVNERDFNFYPIAITDTAQDILNLPRFGAFIVCVSGIDSTLPTRTWSLCKADATAAGSIAVLGTQVGTGAWAGNTLTITSTTTNFQIRHDRAGVTGAFNIRVIGTQLGD